MPEDLKDQKTEGSAIIRPGMLREVGEFEKVMAAGDAWLRKYGILDPEQNPLLHNNIILNLYAAFPKVKHVEYDFDAANKIIDLTLQVGFWTGLTMNKDRFLDSVLDFLRDYLHDFTITARVARYKTKRS